MKTTSVAPSVTGAPVVAGTSSTMPMTEAMPAPTAPQRTGLLARLRMRRTVQ
jgi:hypothetical protein